MTDTTLEHYGIIRRSGRYPWGSGKDPYQRGMAFYAMVDELKAKGLTDKQIADVFSLGGKEGSGSGKVSALKQATSIAKAEVRAAQVAQAMALKQKNMSNTAIGERMGINESSVRSLLDPSIQERQSRLHKTIDMVRNETLDKGYVQIGKGSEHYATGGVSRDMLNTAVAVLKDEGFTEYWVNQEQAGIAGNKTTVKVLASPEKAELGFPALAADPSQIKMLGVHTPDKGKTWNHMKPPVPVSQDRIQVVYGPDGGDQADGLIELRRGAEDLDLGRANYAQVRILVDGDTYLKGVAVVRDDLPDGVDIRFYTPKVNTGNKADVFKPVEPDPTNPFGSTIANQRGAINIVNEEGDWGEWANNLSSQMMSKQPVPVTQTQLRLLRESRAAELESIKNLTNPTLKQELLLSFADSADSDATNLQAMSLPRTYNHVIIPVPEMKDNEVYAPRYKQGERVVLIRHPHAGIFEIPELVVNNRNPAAQKILGKQPADAIAINATVAEQLSGADFDGDTVLVIPNPDGRIKTSRPVKSLQEFNPREQYKGFEGMKTMTKAGTQSHMGNVTNLITDMQIHGAPMNEVIMAVKHSMVVIDAEKHKLNYKQSAIDHNIAALKKKYQQGGASTIISRASAKKYVEQTKPRPAGEGGGIDPETGELRTVPSGKGRTMPDGTFIPSKMRSTPMAETRDARTLMSSPTGTPIERAYAEHANQLKAMANEARKEYVKTPNLKRDPVAARTYAEEVKTLKSKLITAQMNAPLERQAQVVAGVKAAARIAENPGVSDDRIKKIRTQELNAAREALGARKVPVEITPREWEAIQAGAIAHSPLREIFNNADPKQVRNYATPLEDRSLKGPQLTRARAMVNMGYTQAEIAETLGVSVSAIQDFLNKN